jgi:hypothetical protein
MEFIAWHSRKPAVHLSWAKWGVWAAYYLGVWTCETELVRLYFLSIPAWIYVLDTALLCRRKRPAIPPVAQLIRDMSIHGIMNYFQYYA